MNRMRSILGLLGFLAVTFAIGFGGAALAPGAGVGTWYESLPKAPWNPPGWIFGPVWTALYVLMSVAAWLVWRARGSLRAVSFPLSLYALQLVLNGLWTLLFFGQQLVVAALVDIVALLVAIAVTLGAFWRVRRAAGALLVPYLAWVAFATSLNAYIAAKL
ncbi:MAG: TspO/MBR family protein [Myxococcales bacterium]|jgi:benzodiazapine receptor